MWAEEAKAKKTLPPVIGRRTHRDGVTQVLVDPEQLETLKEIARLSLSLLEYTETGGAAAMRPTEFTALTKALRLLQPLLAVDPGEGELVAGLLDLLEATED